MDLLIMAFTACIMISSFTAYRPESSSDAWEIWFSWLLVYLLISNIAVTKARFDVFYLVFLVVNLKMAQHAARNFASVGFGFQAVGAQGAPGWFRNSGELGIEMAIYFGMSLYYWMGHKSSLSGWKRWGVFAFPALAGLASIASSSRGSVLGVIAILVWIGLKNAMRPRTLIASVVALGVIWTLIPEASKERFRAMGDDEDSIRRLTYWSDGVEIMNQYPLTGIGYHNWLDYYSDFYFTELENGRFALNDATSEQAQYFYGGAQLPHNPFIEAGAELGYPGLGLFVAMILLSFWTNIQSRRKAKTLEEGGWLLFHLSFGLDAALIAFLVSGFFVSVLYYPFFWVNYALISALERAVNSEMKQARVRKRPKVPNSGWPASGGARQVLANLQVRIPNVQT